MMFCAHCLIQLVQQEKAFFLHKCLLFLLIPFKYSRFKDPFCSAIRFICCFDFSLNNCRFESFHIIFCPSCIWIRTQKKKKSYNKRINVLNGNHKLTYCGFHFKLTIFIFFFHLENIFFQISHKKKNHFLPIFSLTAFEAIAFGVL